MMPVHPRWCGVCAITSRPSDSLAGPPPLVRGLRILPGAGLPGRRSTPAGAGFAIVLRYWGMSEQVHPRWCGVCDSPALLGHERAGPPPLVRGLRSPRPRPGAQCRSTPAGAGFAAGSRPASWEFRVHPRWCGVCAGCWSVVMVSMGPPPLVRGLPESRAASGEHPRSTPAGAGFAQAKRIVPLDDTVHPRWCGVCPSGMIFLMGLRYEEIALLLGARGSEL